MYVTAKSGLVVRDSPSLNSNKIFHLPYNSMIMVSEKTGTTINIIDEGKEINGEWMKIRSFDDTHRKGYVFGGFLTTNKPDIWYSGKEAFYKTYDFENQQEGTFKSRSDSKKYLNDDLYVIKPNITTLKKDKFPHFLNPQDKALVLFKNHDLKNLKPAGILNSLTQVKIDSTFYKLKFKDYTNCVWNRIKIDGKYYYTDIDIHDFSVSKKLTKLNQKVEIIGQYDGYDGAYHLGYPEHFFMIFTDNENKIIAKTLILDFYLNNEFAMDEEIVDIKWNQGDKSYSIALIGHEEKIRVRWNGKKYDTQKL